MNPSDDGVTLGLTFPLEGLGLGELTSGNSGLPPLKTGVVSIIGLIVFVILRCTEETLHSSFEAKLLFLTVII